MHNRNLEHFPRFQYRLIYQLLSVIKEKHGYTCSPSSKVFQRMQLFTCFLRFGPPTPDKRLNKINKAFMDQCFR